MLTSSSSHINKLLIQHAFVGQVAHFLRMDTFIFAAAVPPLALFLTVMADVAIHTNHQRAAGAAMGPDISKKVEEGLGFSSSLDQ